MPFALSPVDTVRVGIPEPRRASGSCSALTGPPARRVYGRVLLELPTRRTALWRLVKPLLGVICLLMVVAAATYTALVATLLAFPVVDGSRLVVVRAAYPGLAMPSGAIVAVAPEPVRDRPTWMQLADVFGVDEVSVVRVLRGPYGAASTSPVFLDGQYETECITGSGCDPGQVLIVEAQTILGAVRSVVSGPEIPTDVAPVQP